MSSAGTRSVFQPSYVGPSSDRFGSVARQWQHGYVHANEERRSVKEDVMRLASQLASEEEPTARHLSNELIACTLEFPSLTTHLLKTFSLTQVYSLGGNWTCSSPDIRAEPFAISMPLVGWRKADESAFISVDVPQPVERPFAPSEQVTRFVVDRVGAELGDSVDKPTLHRLASAQIKEAVLGLLHSMAESLRRTGSKNYYIVGAKGKFEEAVAKAIVFRVSVGFYEAPDFAAALFRELSSAAARRSVSGPFWTLLTRDDGSSVLELTETGAPSVARPRREKAKVIKVAAKT